MKPKQISLLLSLSILIVCGSAAGLFVWRWLAEADDYQVVLRLPGADGGPTEAERAEAAEVKVELTGTLETFDGTASDLPGNWPRFRGADFDNIAKGSPKLADICRVCGRTTLFL